MYFTFKGIPSYQLGITVTKRPTFTVAAQQLSTYDTPGIDGLLVENEGKHSIVIQFDIAIDNMDKFDDINEWLTGSGRFTRSDYPDRYMNVEVQSGLFNQYLGGTTYQTPISFYAYDPYWYPTENVDRPYRDLIKDDFSDFNAYQGAVVTRNKTFPIDVFKGGRNVLLGSKGTIDLTTLTWEPFAGKTWEEIGE